MQNTRAATTVVVVVVVVGVVAGSRNTRKYGSFNRFCLYRPRAAGVRETAESCGLLIVRASFARYSVQVGRVA